MHGLLPLAAALAAVSSAALTWGFLWLCCWLGQGKARSRRPGPAQTRFE